MASKKNHEAAVKALADADAYFKRQNLDSAIEQATQAKNLDPELPNVDNIITAYTIHRDISCKKSWYEVLGIPKCTHSLNISKRYKQLALMVHPDKNVSAAAEGAFKHVKDALDYLSDPVRKKEYDAWLQKKNKGSSYDFAPAGRKPATATSAAGKSTSRAANRRKAAAAADAAAARKEDEAAAARSELNARKQQRPTNEIDLGIHLIKKYSSKYMKPRVIVS